MLEWCEEKQNTDEKKIEKMQITMEKRKIDIAVLKKKGTKKKTSAKSSIKTRIFKRRKRCLPN
jgi:hypothetical protein